MKYIIALTIVFVCLGISAQSPYEQAYIVDTIHIDNSHKAFIEKGGHYFTIYFEESRLEIVKKGKLKKIINDEHVYFTALNFYSFFSSKNLYLKGPLNCDEILTSIQKGKVDVFKVEGVDKYILCLINIEEFNKRQKSVDYNSWTTKLDKGTFVKVVFPLCE